MERQRCHLSFTVHSQNAHIARTVLDWSKECKLSPDLYMSVRDPNFWANTCCLPVCTVAGSWSWKWSWYSKPSVLIMGCEHLKQCLNCLNQMFIPSLLFDYLSNVSWSLGNVGTWFFLLLVLCFQVWGQVDVVVHCTKQLLEVAHPILENQFKSQSLLFQSTFLQMWLGAWVPAAHQGI